MNLEQLQRKLLAAARRHSPDDRVPYAFEKRILARISAAAIQRESLWGYALWRAAISCVAVTVLCGVWSLSPVGKSAAHDSTEDFSQAFENTLLAPADQHGDDTW